MCFLVGTDEDLGIIKNRVVNLAVEPNPTFQTFSQCGVFTMYEEYTRTRTMKIHGPDTETDFLFPFQSPINTSRVSRVSTLLEHRFN